PISAIPIRILSTAKYSGQSNWTCSSVSANTVSKRIGKSFEDLTVRRLRLGFRDSGPEIDLLSCLGKTRPTFCPRGLSTRVLLRALRSFCSGYIWVHTDRNRTGKATVGVTTARVVKIPFPFLLFVRAIILQTIH